MTMPGCVYMIRWSTRMDSGDHILVDLGGVVEHENWQEVVLNFFRGDYSYPNRITMTVDDSNRVQRGFFICHFYRDGETESFRSERIVVESLYLMDVVRSAKR
jgi:hypothetical protein